MDLNGRRNRKHRKASGIYKLETLFRDAEKKVLLTENSTHYINGRLGEYLIVSVPETTSRASAVDLESALTKIAKKPVLIVTHNIEFLRATLLSAKERAELAEIIDQATQKEEPENASPAAQ